jgi:serine/threonine protein kinase
MWSGPDVVRSRPFVLGKYRLIAELGQGGMADVYLAASEGLGGFHKLIVVKRLRNLEDPQHMAMFLDEARIARRLSHSNIVQTYEIGQENGAHFIVMEYLHGPTLQRLRRAAVAERGVPWAIEIEIMCHVLEGLHYAHELRAADGRPLHVVHRDLSPENVIVTQVGDTKILDFGIAKAIDSLSHTQAGFCKGKLKNMPPEQLLGEKVDRRADLFAAGVMLWEGLSGRPLWGNTGNAGIASRLAQGDIPSLADAGPGVPEELRAVCARALSVTPDGRYATALEFKAALVDYVRRNQLEVTRSQLAAFVEPLFAQERDRIDRIVQMHLAPSSGSDVMAALGAPVTGPLSEPPSVPSRTPMPRTPVSSPGTSPVRTPSTQPGGYAIGSFAAGGQGGPTPSGSQTAYGHAVPSGFAAGGTVALDVEAMVPLRSPSLHRNPRRRLPLLVTGALVLGVGALALVRLPPSGPRPPAEITAPWVEPTPVAGTSRVPELTPPTETAPSSVEMLGPAAVPAPRAGGARRKPSSRGRSVTHSRPSDEGVTPVPAVARPATDPGRREFPARWNGRDLDRDSPYGAPTPAAPAAPRPRPTIDRNNPWPVGDPQ